MCRASTDTGGAKRCLTHTTQAVQRRQVYITGKEEELTKVQATKPQTSRTRAKIRRLTATIEKKKVELSTAAGTLDAFRQKLEEEQALKEDKAEQNKKIIRRVQNGDAEELGRNFRLLFTGEELEEIDKKRGTQTRSDYILKASITNKPVFTERPISELQMNITTRGTTNVGRSPSVNHQVRDAEANIRGEAGERTAARLYLRSIAQQYGLQTNAYMRYRTLGNDLYAPEGHMSEESNRMRLEELKRRQDAAGITLNSPVEEVTAFRENFDKAASQRAWAIVSDKFGQNVVNELQTSYSHNII